MKKTLPIRENMILIAIDSNYVYIPKDVFVLLFENSHIYYKKEYMNAIDDSRIKFTTLKKLSREAGIPFSLFFAPADKVKRNIDENNEILFRGVNDVPITIATRGDIRIRDVNLIIKDIQKRQQFLAKSHRGVGPNKILNIRQQQTIENAACTILTILNLDMDKFRRYTTKEGAYEYLVSCLEHNNIIVSRSRRGVMPQSIKIGLAFSGISIKHSKYPAIFLHSKDEDVANDPTGRRIFTIFFLLACMANKRFATVSYNQNAQEPARNIEYLIAEEMLMPENMISGISIDCQEDLKNVSNVFKVTPSMALVRLKRLQLIDDRMFNMLFQQLRDEWDAESLEKVDREHKFNAKDPTKIIAYNGRLFANEIISQLRSGKISEGDASRLLLFKRKRTKAILREVMERI